MEIEISKNLLKSCKENNENRSDIDIFKEVFNILIIDKIIKSNFNFEDIKWNITKEQYQGVYIKSEKHIVQFCRKTGEARNTFLSQAFPIVYKLSKTKKAKMSISINPFDKSNLNKITTPSLIFQMEQILTLEVNINDSLRKLLVNDISPLTNLEKYIESKNSLRTKNTRNNGLYIDSSYEDKIRVYGKFDGANSMESFLIMCTLEKLNKNNILELIEIPDNNNKLSLSKNLSKEIKNLGFDIINYSEKVKSEEDNNNLPSNIVNISQNSNFEKEEKDIKRAQDKFYFNIIKKYFDYGVNFSECFACDYKIEKNLIRSHIHRFSDINKDYKENNLTFEQASTQANSGDNGFLLCPNQDKEFENGFIYFDIETKSFLANKEKINNYENYLYISDKIVTKNFLNNNEIITDEFINNVIKHQERHKQNS